MPAIYSNVYSRNSTCDKRPKLTKRKVRNKGNRKRTKTSSHVHRYNWTIIPNKIVIAAAIIFIISYITYGEVLRENRYLTRTIKVGESQKLVDTGLYKIVRHPMYTITVILFLTMPIILGSIFSLVIFLIYPIIIAKRIENEEKVLEKELKGYKEYQKRVKYRLIPFIW